jgi:hypothetical protein
LPKGELPKKGITQNRKGISNNNLSNTNLSNNNSNNNSNIVVAKATIQNLKNHILEKTPPFLNEKPNISKDNISKDKINNNTFTKKQKEEEFNFLWKLYPRKE